MYSEVHANRVFYRNAPKAGHKYLQIAIVEKEQFELRVFRGDVVQVNPFLAPNSDAEVYFHPTLQAALSDLEKEYQASIAAGWIPFQGTVE